MDYAQPYRQKHYHRDNNHNTKENEPPNIMKQRLKPKPPTVEQLQKQVYKLQREVKDKDIELKENHHLNSKVKTELLQVSKKETEEYANNIELYAKEFQDLNQKNESLNHKLTEYQQREQQQQQQLQTLAVGLEQQNEKNMRKEEQMKSLQHKNMSLQHEKVLLQQQLQSVRDNFFNDDDLMRTLCHKLEIESCHNFKGLAQFVSHSKQMHDEYNGMKQELDTRRQDSERYKMELISYKKQLEIYEDSKNIEKGQLIHMESLRAENENLRKEIRILEDSNSKLANDLIARSEQKMNLMTESLTRMQEEHHKIYAGYEKQIEKVKRERKAYQHKCEHFKKEAKGFATKYEELNQKHSELEQQCAIYQRNDDNVSEDYERRMSELEANNDALNEQLQSARHEIEELNLLKDNLTKDDYAGKKQMEHLKQEMELKERHILQIKHEKDTLHVELKQLKASKGLMETMWNEFKHNQSQQNELLLNNLEAKIEHNQQKELHRFNEQIQDYQQQIYALKQQIASQEMNKTQNEQIALLQQENDALTKHISDLKRQMMDMNELPQSADSSLMFIRNNDTLKQRSRELKKENMDLHKELNQIKRNIENHMWEKTVNEQKLNNEIQILETKLCHHQSRLNDKILEIEELKKLLNGAEGKVEEIRNKYESALQVNARMETQTTNLNLYNQSLKANIQEHKDEIKALRQTMDAWYDKHGVSAVYEKFGDSSKSELVHTLKQQNHELRRKIETSQDTILLLKEEIAALKQSNHTLSDRYESNAKVTESRDSQIEQLRQSLADTQNRESKLMKQLTETKMHSQQYKMQSQQFQTQMIDIKQQNANLSEQIKYLQFQNSTEQQDKFEQFTNLTNKLEIAGTNAAQLKITNAEMHQQIEYLKKAYEELDNELNEKENKLAELQHRHTALNANTKYQDELMVVSGKYKALKAQYAKKEDAHHVISKKYEILKEHWEGLNKDRSDAIEKLKTEAQRVSVSENKLSTLELAIAKLNHERSRLEKEKKEHHELLGKLKIELNKQQMQLENVGEEKLKLAQAQRKVTSQAMMTEVKVQEEMRMLKVENSNLKQEVEKHLYEIEDIQNKNKQIGGALNEWKLKYDEINEKYEFESGQHDNTLKKLNELRAIWDGETNLNQLVQMKQQTILELQSKLNEYGKMKEKYGDIMKENEHLKVEMDRTQKVIDEQTNMQSSLKTRINVQRNIINQQNKPNGARNGGNDELNRINVTLDEYHQLQQQLNLLTELQNKYEMAQQEIMELKQKLSRWQDVKTDLDTSELVINYNKHANHESIPSHMEQLVAYLHKKEQSLHDLQEEYEGIKTENSALIQRIQHLDASKLTMQNAVKEAQHKQKTAEQTLADSQHNARSMEGHRDSLSKKLRTVTAENAKLRVELYSLSSAADLVQEQLKTSAVALSTTTDKKQQLIQEMDNLRDTLKSAEQQIMTLQNDNSELQNYNANMLNQFNTLKFTHQSLRESSYNDHKSNTQTNNRVYEKQSELIHSIQSEREKFQTEFATLHEKYNGCKSEAMEMKAKAELVTKQLDKTKRDHDALNNECFDLKRTVKQLENARHSMNLEKQQITKQMNKVQKKYCDLFDEHNRLTQKYQSTNHEISDMKLQKQTAFIERDLLDYKVEQLQGDKSNIALQLDKLKSAYIEQSNKLKAEHNELCHKYQAMSSEREALKMQTEQLASEKETLQNVINTYQQQLEHQDAHRDSRTFEIQHKYDELSTKTAELASKLTARNIEHEELKASYERVSDKLTNAQLKIEELNMVCDESKHDHKHTKDRIETIQDKFLQKKDDFEQLQLNYHEQENKVIKANHDLQTLLTSYNAMSAENEHLHSENAALYEQIQMAQMDKFIQNTKIQSNDALDKTDKDAAHTFNGITVNLQSLIKRGKLLTEQCADLNVENKKLKIENQTRSEQVSKLQQEISLLNITHPNRKKDHHEARGDHEDKKEESIAPTESKAVALVSALHPSPHHEAVLRELRHRNEQLMDQVRCLQHDLETDTELIDRLQKENGELRIKLKTFLQRYHHHEDPQTIIAVDAKGEPWQDIIKGLRKQLQEARREIAQLCEESMGKTQHINQVESVNSQLIKNVDCLEKENKELTASLATTPNTEPSPEDETDPSESRGQLAEEYAKTERLCDEMESMLTKYKAKEALKRKLKQLDDHLKQTKTLCIDMEHRNDQLSKQNEVIQRELSLLKRAKGQLSDHNEQLATEITNLQSIQFEQQQKISSQQQEMSELQTLYQNVQSQLEIKESLNQQLQSERHQIVRIFAMTDATVPNVPKPPKQSKMVDLGGFDYNEESKMESMEPSMFDFNAVTKGGGKGEEIASKAKFETLDIKHEIECLLNSYHKMTEKNTELQHVIDRNQKEYSIQNDFNAKFEEIKRLLMDAAQARGGANQESLFLSTPNSLKANEETMSTKQVNNGSANYGDDSQRKMSLSANISPFRHGSISAGGPRDVMNMTNPDLLNTSMQYMEDIMNTHKLMKEEEFEQLVHTKKELMDELESTQSKYDSLSREYANQTQKLSLMEQESKHVSNQLDNVQKEREALRSELQNNKQLTDKLSKDFKAIGHERDHLYQKIKSLQMELENKEFETKKEEEYHALKQEINELNDLNMKQSHQIELLQSKKSRYEEQVKESKHRYNSITSDFKSIKTKYERLNEEYDNLSSQQQKLYYEMNEIKQMNQQKATQIFALENRLTCALDEGQKYEQQISKNKLKFESEITDYQSTITELQLALDSTKFEMVAKQSSDSNKHIEDLNEQLELLRNKYENKSRQTKTHYSEKIVKMNEAVTKLSAARTKLQNQLMDKEAKHNKKVEDLKEELTKTVMEKEQMRKEMTRLQTELQVADKKNEELDDRKALLLEDCNRRIESALKHKTTVDKELEELQELHHNKIHGMDTRFEDLLGKYQQSVQENEIIKVAKEQHQMLVKEIDHLHAQLKQSRHEHQQLRQKAQLHYTRRKEEWKKFKQLETAVNKKDETIRELAQKEVNYMKQIHEYKKTEIQSMNESELNSLCTSIEDTMHKLTDIVNNKENNNNNNGNKSGARDGYSLSNLFSFLQAILVALTSLCTTSQIRMQQLDKSNENDDKYKEELIESRRQQMDLTKENEKLRFNELNIRSEVEEYKTKLNAMKKKMEETETLLENERLNWKKQSKNHNIEFQELADKCKIIEQQNTNLRSQMLQLNHDIQELEDENNNLRDERRRSLEGNTSEHLSEKINLQRQIRIIREERDIAEKKLKENESKYNQLTLKSHQLQLQFESAQQRVDHLENSKRKLKQQLNANDEVLSTLEAEKMSLSKKNNELYDGNVTLEEKNRKSQQEIGKFQVKSDRLRQQRDYAKLKYKELKAKFNSLEQQFRGLQSRFNHQSNTSSNQNQNQNKPNSQTSQTMPF